MASPIFICSSPLFICSSPLSICSSVRSHRFTGYSALASQALLSNSKAFSQQVCFTSIFYAFHKSQPKVSSKCSPPHPSSAAVSAAKEANRAASSVLLPEPLSGKLSTGRLVTICELLKDGKNTIENACAVAGVGRTSLYDSGSGSSGRHDGVACAPHDGGDFSGKRVDVCGVSCTCCSM